MVVYIRYGTRLSGKIDAFAGSYIATRFFHIYYIPLIPMSSWLVLKDGSGVSLPLNVRSMLAAWLRGLGSIAALVALFVTMSSLSAHEFDGDRALELLVPTLLVGGAVWSWAILGRLSRKAKAERLVYYDALGHFGDPARLGDGRHVLIEKLRKDVHSRAQALAGMGYRESYDPETAWRRVAARPSTKDLPFLKAALTLARLEWSFASGEHQRALARDHALIFENIERAHPQALKLEKVAA